MCDDVTHIYPRGVFRPYTSNLAKQNPTLTLMKSNPPAMTLLGLVHHKCLQGLFLLNDYTPFFNKIITCIATG